MNERHDGSPKPGGAPEDTGRSPRTFWKRIKRLAIILAVTYAGVCLAVFVFQDRMLYFPTAAYNSDPSDLGLHFEAPTLTTSDGVRIAAWYVPRADAAGTVLFCHGNAGNMSDRLVTIHTLHELGYNVLIFDYRGYGRSEGQPNEVGTYADGEAAWEYLRSVKKEPPNRIVLCGRSLGGAVAVELAHRHRPAALVVESTFTRLADVAAIHYPLLPVRLLVRNSYDSISKVPKVNCPKLFLHTRHDEIIPLELGRRLYEAACHPKQFIETPGDHNNGGFTYSSRYSSKLGLFLQEALTDHDTDAGD